MKKPFFVVAGRLLWQVPLVVVAVLATGLMLLAQLVLFVLLGEFLRPALEGGQGPGEPAAAPPTTPEPSTYVVDARGRLCELYTFSSQHPRVEKEVSGRFTRFGRLLVSQ